MSRLSRERLVRCGLVFVLLAGVLVATFGAGYRSSGALLGDASAYLQRDHDVVRVNAESADVDAETARELATGEQRLDVVQVSAGVVYAVNTETGKVWRLPTDTMQPQQVDEHPDADGQLDLVAGGERAYLVDAEEGTVALLEDPSGTGRAEVALPDRARVAELVVDSSGIAWALSRERGELYAIDGTTLVARHPVADPGEPTRLTLAGDAPIVYRPERGVATRYGRRGSLDDVTVPRERQVEVASPGADSPLLVTIVPRTAELVTADVTTGETARIALTGRAGNRFGPPVVARGRAYVPDYTDRHVVVVRLHPLRELSYEKVHGRGEFEVFARDGRVWVNDPYDRELLSFDRNGRPSRMDKQTGEDRPEEPPEPTEKPEPPGPPTPPREPVPDPTEAPEPAEPEPAMTVVPPNAVALEETCAAVEAAGLVCRPEVAGYASSVLDYHHVVSYDPPTGTEVKVGTEVRVGHLELAGTYPVPNVVGMAPSQACQTLQAYFLQCTPNASEVHWQTNTVHIQGIPPGTAVAPGTAVEIVYSGSPSPYSAPVQLTRYRFIGPNGQQPAWHLTIGAKPGRNWTNPHQFGGVYSPYENAVPGLVPVYQAVCTNCGVNAMYFYSPQPRTPSRPGCDPGGGAAGCVTVWRQHGPVFKCFASPVPRTAPLMKMYSDQRKAWTFAVQGSDAYWHRRSDAGGRFRDQGPPICHVWYRVPPFPGS